MRGSDATSSPQRHVASTHAAEHSRPPACLASDPCPSSLSFPLRCTELVPHSLGRDTYSPLCAAVQHVAAHDRALLAPAAARSVAKR